MTSLSLLNNIPPAHYYTFFHLNFRVDDLYRFLMVWVPHLYGDLDEETVSSRGYELVDSDTELWEDGSESPEHSLGKHRRESGDDGALARESWEVSRFLTRTI